LGSKRDGNHTETPWRKHRKWIRLWILGCSLLLSTSCVQPTKDSLFGKQIIQTSGQESAAKARLQRGLKHLERGNYKTARETFTRLLQEDTAGDVAPAAAFYVGVLRLLEMEDLAGMEACRGYFQRYAKDYESGLYKDNAASILRFLDKQIAVARRAQEQERQIQTLKYQIEELEEIQEETERKRRTLQID
jgi:hypothetical protein